MSLTSDLKSPRSPVGRWARDRFPQAKALYPLLAETAEPVLVRPDGWGDGSDQRWSWAGMACDTMLRWRLGATDASAAKSGARRLVGDLSRHDLGRLVAAAPALDDTAAAARVAVLWALAEQHMRYLGAQNPLTDVAGGPAQALLACVPDDVVADVVAVCDGPAASMPADIARLGPIEAGLDFRSYPGGADLDLIAGTSLVEIKTTTSRRGLTDVLQALGYALLAEPGRIDTLVWAFPRSGKMLQVPLDDAVAQITDVDGVTVDMLRGELAEAAGIRR